MLPVHAYYSVTFCGALIIFPSGVSAADDSDRHDSISTAAPSIMSSCVCRDMNWQVLSLNL